MDTSFHQLDLKAFNDRIPGALPTPADRTRFLKPNVDKREMSGRSIGGELARAIKSVLDAGGAAHRLEVLHTPCQEDRGDRKGADNSRSELSETGANQGIFGHGSWFGLSVVADVKGLNNEVCAFYMDPGSSDGGAYINRTYGGEVGLDRLSESMLGLLTVQHRLFSYGLYVKWNWARAFDWTETTSLLHDFVWKVAHMTPEQLGYDPTALVASKSDVEKLCSKMQDPSLPAEVQQYVRNAFLCKDTQPAETTARNPGRSRTLETDHPYVLDEHPIYRLTVPSSDPPPCAFTDGPAPQLPPSSSPSSSRARPVERAFLVGRPHVAAESRTRGYVAFDLQEQSFCFLKDSWRPLIPGQTRPEHWVYECLRPHNVPGLATLVCGGDVGEHGAQVTAVQNAMPAEKQLVPHVHYRIVIKEIGVPLTEFRNFTELASIVAGALTAHCAAWEKERILHCNVDIEHILINPETREGMLVDWEVSRFASELEGGSVKPDPTGTWRSRSALSLRYPRKPYGLSDDIEAFIHVFRSMVLRFHPTRIKCLHDHVHRYFEQSAKVGSFTIGGETKMDYFQVEKPPVFVIGNPGLQVLLDKIAYLCHHEFYRLVDTDLMEDKYGIPTGRTQHPAPIRRREHDDEPAPDPAIEAYCAKIGWSDVSAAIPLPPPPFKKVDACEIQTGFLADHSKLRSLLKAFHCTGLYDKHEDQFQARAAEEPARAIPSRPARSVQSQDCVRRGIVDGAQAAVVVELPAAGQASPPLRKFSCADPGPSSPPAAAAAVSTPVTASATAPPSTRVSRKHKHAQEHVEVAEGADERDSDRSGGPSTSKKRRKKT